MIDSVSCPPWSKPIYPGGAPISRDTAWRSMYSDMSKRSSSTPMQYASWRATSVLPTPVGPENRKLPIGLRGLPSPERAMRIADTNASIARFCPNTTFLRSRSSVFSELRSSDVTLRAGMRAIFATISSISVLLMTFFCFDFGRIFCAAPASSMTSIALSGRCRSLMKRAESSAAVVSAAGAYLTPWCCSKRVFSPLRISMVSAMDGSGTSIFWNRRDSA